MSDEGQLVLVVGALLAAGLAASLAAGRLRMPGLVLVLGLGMAIGSDGADLIDFGEDPEDFELARQVGVKIDVYPDAIESRPRFRQLFTEYNKYLLRRAAVVVGI